ncbi:MAG: alpha-hydroxy-acid oxidizing protein [Spirochaetaceae bacterium]|nr:alpha-hydroxy-acid oxidizing protein [Spirochaetaceae bacterium]
MRCSRRRNGPRSLVRLKRPLRCSNRTAADRIPIFVDCGIESGMDAFKSLALGAAAVSVGRHLMTPLKDKGAEGVTAEIISMTEKLAGAMARTSSPDLKHIDPALIWHKENGRRV